jgi:hypothetical protein
MLRLMRDLVRLACFLGMFLVALPATASAAVRFASPTGDGDATVCAENDPCPLDDAVGDASVNNGDVVVVLPGTYDLSTGIVIDDAITVRGDNGQPRPLITSDDNDVTPLVLVNSAGAIVRDLKVTYPSGTSLAGVFAVNEAATIERVEVVAGAGAGAQSACSLRTASGGTILIRDSICINNHTGGSLIMSGLRVSAFGGSPTNARVVNVTAVGWGGITAQANGQSATVTVSNSIADGKGVNDVDGQESGFPAAWSVNMIFDHSNYDLVAGVTDGTLTPAGSGTNQTAPPIYLDAANGNYRQAAGSPTINAGDRNLSDLGNLDVDGEPRVQGAGVDIAGEEADVVPPAVQITGGPSGSIVERRPTFTFAAEPGATLQCKIDTFFRACSGPTSDTPASALGPGAHTFQVRATDPTGNQATASRSFTVLPTPTIEVTKVVRNKHRGTAKLSVEVSAAGALALSGKGVKPATGQASGPATLTLPVRPSGGVLRKLRRTGRARVTVTVTLDPAAGGASVSDQQSLKLIRN